jgi:RES domain-containing protein
MEVFRISAPRYAQSLTASGVANRWNTAGQYIIYTAATASLACLENVVHRGAEGLQVPFKLMRLDIPDQVLIEEVPTAMLPAGWQRVTSYPQCQEIGAAWYQLRRSAVLKVPSAIITTEANYLINSNHSECSTRALRGNYDWLFYQFMIFNSSFPKWSPPPTAGRNNAQSGRRVILQTARRADAQRCRRRRAGASRAA